MEKGDYFGVKSYLHNFYETHVFKDPEIYDTDNETSLLRPDSRTKKYRCSSVTLKVSLWVGIALLLSGVVAILVGYLVPQHVVFVGELVGNVHVIDRSAIRFNYYLEVCKVVGCLTFSVGGIVLSASLLVPSCLHSRSEVAAGQGDTCNFRTGTANVEDATKTIPVTGVTATVQPERGGGIGNTKKGGP